MIFPANPLHSLLGCELIIVVYFALGSFSWAQDTPIRFGSEVRPILSNYCFRCHGPDDAHREADLRLDTLEGATTPVGDQQPIVPGSASTSYILERMRTTDESLRMPPIDSGLELTESQIATIESGSTRVPNTKVTGPSTRSQAPPYRSSIQNWDRIRSTRLY